jgi:hypothetical protein
MRREPQTQREVYMVTAALRAVTRLKSAEQVHSMLAVCFPPGLFLTFNAGATCN